MFRKRTAPILGEKIFRPINQLRQAIEVLTGLQVEFQAIDFNTGRVKLTLGGADKELGANLNPCGRADLVDFRFLEEKIWYTGRFNDDGSILVANPHHMEMRRTRLGEIPVVWAGRSATDRKQQPLFIKNAEWNAARLGITIDELMTEKGVANP